jgi:predicted nucleic acid-binding protein
MSTIRPDLLFAETANAISKKIRRKEMTVEEGQRLVADIGGIAVETVSGRALAEDAHALANATGRTVYDCMYVALAARLNTRSIMADDHLEAALRKRILKDLGAEVKAVQAAMNDEDLRWLSFASWLMMRAASLRSVAELLGHQSMKMTMRCAHLSPAFLSAEVSLLDPPPPPASQTAEEGKKKKRARKGQRRPDGDASETKVPAFVKESGSSGWTRTNNPPVNRLTQVYYLVGSSWV